MPDFVLRSRRVVTPEGERPAAVHVRAGVIAAVSDFDDVPAGAPIVEGCDAALLPGLVDTHVHVNEPGRTDWEGFATATRAAAAGGVTTLLDMPLNSIPPTTTAAHLDVKRAAAEGQCWVDVGFWGGAVPDNASDLKALHDAGVFGFKAFLVDSGVDEFECLDTAALAAVAGKMAVLGATLIVHAELPEPIAAASAALGQADPRRYATYLASRPPAAEEEAVAKLIELVRAHGIRVHVLHLSAAGALERLRAARAEGLSITAETCPHYLTLAAEDVADGATAHKCAPPVREAANRERLWDGLRSGAIDFVVSDHSPCPSDLKRPDDGDFLLAWGGISSLQLGLRVVWTEARRRGDTLSDIARWMAEGPARFAGLECKGSIEAGKDADLVLFDPDVELTVRTEELEHRHKVSPYLGKSLVGRVAATWVGGARVQRNGHVAGDPVGRLLERT
ncbi:MAG: allantoinase AllB [Actinomycetota bacterium]|nr:allantoinase AllB [Euzebyaceae bacterium]MDQ3451948.1 allantoinase AllB [Actinomycetota bacterium]